MHMSNENLTCLCYTDTCNAWNSKFQGDYKQEEILLIEKISDAHDIDTSGLRIKS